MRGSTNALPRTVGHPCGVARRVLIVDDHAEFRRSARELLEAEGFETVGEAGDGASAVAEAKRLDPEVVLLDVHLPDVDGFTVAGQLSALPNSPVVVLTSARELAAFAARLGPAAARGFIPKDQLCGQVLAELLR